MTEKPTYEELEKRILELEQEKEQFLRTENKLRESEDNFSKLFELAPVPMAYASEAGGYRGTTWNSAWYGAFGYPKEQAHGQSGNDIGLWVEPADRHRLVEMAKQQNYVENFEASLRCYDGTVLNCSLFGRFIQKDKSKLLMVIYLDITKRKQAEKELRNLRNFLSNIIDSMPSILIGVDAQNKVTQWNKTTEKITGIPAGEAHGELISDVFPGIKSQFGLISQSIHTREVVQELKSPRDHGNVTCYEDVTIYPLTSNGVDGAVIRVDDVTEKVNMERMMVQNEKMLSLGGLAAGMAHEINNPLAGMIQTADVISNRIGGRLDVPANIEAAKASGTTIEAIQKYMEIRGIPSMISTIRETGRRAAEIVDNMLKFARKEEAEISSYHPIELIDKTLELAASDYDLTKHYDFKTIEIKKDYEDNLPLLPCEGAKIQQVLLNILRNGAQAMQEKIEANPDFRPILYLRLKQEIETGMLRIEIEDNGPGMSEETCQRIFEPFFTTKPVGVGTGLGLSISYFIITEGHEGQMSVKSTPGKGTKFTIQLPFSRTS